MTAVRPERRQHHRVVFPMEIRYRSSSEVLGMWRDASAGIEQGEPVRFLTHQRSAPS